MAAFAAPTDSRERLYKSLMWRNRIVGALRWLVPAGGAAVLALVVGLIVLDGLAQRFGFSNIRIDRDNLVVETPKLTSTGEDGTLYSLTALAAKVGTGQSDMIDMQNARFTMTPTDGPEMAAAAADARFQTTGQLLSVPGITHITNTDGLDGTLEGVFADLMNWKMTASGNVDIQLPDGSTITSHGMTYDRTTGIYTFKDATVNLMLTPGETE